MIFSAFYTGCVRGGKRKATVECPSVVCQSVFPVFISNISAVMIY